MASEVSPLIPTCYHSQPSEYGYEVNSSFNREKASYRLGDSASMLINMNFIESKLNATPYGGSLWPVQLIVERGGDDVVRLTLSSPGHEEGTLLTDPFAETATTNGSKLDVLVTQNENEAFNVTVYRIDTPKNQTIFSTIFGPLIVGEGYIEFTTIIPSKYVIGMGSRMSSHQNPDFDDFEKWSFNSLDPSFGDSSLPSTHPFYMCLEPATGNVHGVYLKSSTPLQIGTIPAPGFSFRAHMGAFRILVMAGPDPTDVSRQFTDIVGRPSLPPYWTFGFHMCRTTKGDKQESTYRSAYTQYKLK